MISKKDPSSVALLPGREAWPSWDKVSCLTWKRRIEGRWVGARPPPAPAGSGWPVTARAPGVVSAWKARGRGAWKWVDIRRDVATRQQIDARPRKRQGLVRHGALARRQAPGVGRDGYVVLYDVAARQEIRETGRGGQQDDGPGFQPPGRHARGNGATDWARVWGVKDQRKKWSGRTGEDDSRRRSAGGTSGERWPSRPTTSGC